MAKFCLTKPTIERFKKALRDKEIDPLKMADMTSQQRREFLTKYFGDQAIDVNALFESKLLLKNQKAGYISWAKKVAGISVETKRDLISRIERMTNVLSPSEEITFLNDLAASKLGVEVTEAEAKVVSDLATRLSELRESWNPKTLEWASKADKKAYGTTQRSLEKYVEELKQGKFTLSQIARNRGTEFKNDFSENKIRAVGKLVLDGAKTIAENSVSIVASFDDSLFGRQGVMALLSGHPIIWSRNFAKSFSDIVRTFGGVKTTDVLLSEIYSDPLYMNGEYKKAGIVDISEEQYPTSLPERIPILGKPFEASQAAFTNGSLRMRMELYTLLRNAKVARGIQMTDAEVIGTGRVVNSVLAKGALGRHGQNPIVRLLMWAPKMLKADIDILTAHSFSDIPKADRVTARWNLIKIITATIIINAIANANGKETELDPRSSDFLKIDKKYGYLRGIPQIITLFARLQSGEFKNKDGEIIEYEPGIGKRSLLDVVYTFLRGKAPPATGAIYDILAEEDYQGNPPTFTSILMQKGVPISMQNLIKLANDPTVDNTFGVIGDFFGLNSNISPEPNAKTGYIEENKPIGEKAFMIQVQLYAKAYGTDPETAWNKMFKGQYIEEVEGGMIKVMRVDSPEEATKRRKESKNFDLILDHTIPVALAGDEKPENWKMIPKALWKSYTPVETALIKAVKRKDLKIKEAQKLITKFKGIEDKKTREAYGLELRSKYK